MGTLRVLAFFAIILSVVREAHADENNALDPATLDPTDFNSAVMGYGAVIDSKPYANFVEKSMEWVCYYHFLYLLMPACQVSGGGIPDPVLCCDSIKAFVEADQGKCLCHDRVALDPSVLPTTLKLLNDTQCSIAFPIPEVSSPQLLGSAIPNSPACEGVPRTAGNTINPKFLEENSIDENTDPDDLPSFRELFEGPPSGPYPTSYTAVNVTRPKDSILVNDFSTPSTFGAFIVYPADKDKEENIDAATGAVGKPVLAQFQEDGKENENQKFPIVEFSPGFTSPPQIFLLMMSHLASFGMVVISQESTSPIRSTVDRAIPEAWADDMAYGLLYLKNEGANPESFLFDRVDSNRAGISGHSFGGSMSFPATRRAVDLGINVLAVAPLQPACVPFADICDLAGDASLEKLQGIDYLIISGSEDKAALPSHSDYFATLVEPNVRREDLDKVNHCLVEIDPKFWLLGSDCAIGEVSPMDQAKQVQELVGNFFKEKLVEKS